MLYYWNEILNIEHNTWCWERLRTVEGDNRGWDGWMASPTRWTWAWVSSGSWWWTGKPGVLQSMGLQRIGHDWVNWILSWIVERFSFGFTNIHNLCLYFSFNNSNVENIIQGSIYNVKALWSSFWWSDLIFIQNWPEVLECQFQWGIIW